MGLPQISEKNAISRSVSGAAEILAVSRKLLFSDQYKSSVVGIRRLLYVEGKQQKCYMDTVFSGIGVHSIGTAERHIDTPSGSKALLEKPNKLPVCKSGVIVH